MLISCFVSNLKPESVSKVLVNQKLLCFGTMFAVQVQMVMLCKGKFSLDVASLFSLIMDLSFFVFLLGYWGDAVTTGGDRAIPQRWEKTTKACNYCQQHMCGVACWLEGSEYLFLCI